MALERITTHASPSLPVFRVNLSAWISTMQQYHPVDAIDGYLGQLQCYATAARALWPEGRVSRLGVFFLGSGTLVWGVPASR